MIGFFGALGEVALMAFLPASAGGGGSGPATQIAANSSTSQSATVDTNVSAPPSVIVRDASNNPVQGVAVTFQVTAGAGSINSGQTSVVLNTNASGVATLTNWKLGIVAGTNNNTVTATAAGLTGSPVTFNASGTAGAATTIVANSPTSQSKLAGQAVDSPPSVKVTDQYNNPKSGVSVTFAVTAGGGSLSGTNPITTDASGIATIGSWTLGATPGANTCTATSAGLTGSPVTFNATGLAAESIVIEKFQYCETWTKLEPMGGTRNGFFLPAQTERRRNVNGDWAYRVWIPKTNRCVPNVDKGAAIREVLSLDGTQVREWVVDTYQLGAGDDPFLVVDCIPPFHLLVNYPIELTDADGFVSQETSAVQVNFPTIVGTWLLGRAPSWVVPGTLDPTGLWEIPFSYDSILSGARRAEEITNKEPWLRRLSGSTYGLDFTTIGASAPPLYVRAGKNLTRFLKKVVPGTVTRVEPIVGRDTDRIGASGIARAYWKVVAKSGSGPYDVQVAAIHGGDGPIAFDNQFNHANLPGGANSLYLEAEDGTLYQITGSFVSNQTFRTPTNPTAIVVDGWVRVVQASGKDLTFLDNPTAMASYGVLAGKFESAFDDTLQIAKNALQEAWANPTSRPDGWTGSVLASRTTAAGEWATAAQALKVVGGVNPGAQIAAPPSRAWKITNRRSFFSATSIIRVLTQLPTADSQIVLRLTANGTVVGEMGYGKDRYNEMIQLQLSGIDLAAYIGTTPTLVAELVYQSSTSTALQMIVDSIPFGPSLTARAPCEGSNDARTWQEANRWLKDKSTLQVAYELGAADLAALGVSGQATLALGQTVYVYPYETNLPTEVSARLLEIRDRSESPGDAQYVIGTLPPRLSREQAKPADLVIPFFEPIHVQWAKDDARNAALFLAIKTPLTDNGASVTINLDLRDSRGGSPTVAAAALGGATVISGSGAGPWEVGKPAAGQPKGRVVFTAKLAGRSDVTDAIDIDARTDVDPALEGRSVKVSANPGQIKVRVWATDGTGGVTVTSTFDAAASGLSISPGSGGTFSSIASATATPVAGEFIEYTISRPAFGTEPGRVEFVLTAASREPSTVVVDVAPIERDTIALSVQIELLTVASDQLTLRIRVVDPFPPPNTSSVTVTPFFESTLGYSAILPSWGQQLTPTASFQTTGFVDYQVARVGPGMDPARFTARASDDANGRIATAAAMDVPPQAGPELWVRDKRESATQWRIMWDAVGTVQVSKNGGAWDTPATAGITNDTPFNRHASNVETYSFRCYNGVYPPFSPTFPPPPTDPDVPIGSAVIAGPTIHVPPQNQG